MSTLKVVTTTAGLLCHSLCGTLLVPMLQTQSQPPAPTNPVPPATNPTPRPANPLPRPQQPVPSRPGDRNNPAQPSSQPPVQDRGSTPTDQNAGARSRAERPFAFQSPDMETRFNEGTQRLLRMEQRMARANEEQLRRLGEIRTLPADRQNAALYDLLQQVLRDQAETQRYLVASRSLWTGDVSSSGEMDQAAPSNIQTPTGREPSGSTPPA